MHRIVYVSAASSRDGREDCEAILASARKRNAELGVTGLLLYTQGSFFQVLEGKEGDVKTIFERIERDTRHRSIIKLLDEDVEKRAFADWAMAWFELSKDDPLSDQVITCVKATREGGDVEEIAPHVGILITSFLDVSLR